MLRITVELLPGGDESRPEVVAHGRICNLREHPPGSDLGNFHAYFEANEVPQTEPGPHSKPGDPRATYHTIGTGVTRDFPRYDASVWDLVCEMLQQSGRGRPVRHGGLMLKDVPS
jgi:hypothetical protein